MKIYLAGYFFDRVPPGRLGRLYSFHLHKNKMGPVLDSGGPLFLDSGAFSAYNSGAAVNIDDYISFAHEYQDDFDVYVNLDVIGDAKATLENQKIMEKAGLNPLPVFHRGEDFKYLDYYLERYSHIGLGGIAQSKNRRELVHRLDLCFARACDEEGRPRVRIHGFGITTISLMIYYPWYSVDSTTWLTGGKFGRVLIPNKVKGEWKYDSLMSQLQMTPDGKCTRHIRTFPLRSKKIVEEYIESRGFTLEQVVEDYHVRDELNVLYFESFQNKYYKWPWPLFKRKRRDFGLV